ncbi:hypothetical protein IZU99_09525 [Oscillospiraceae bacterium CM]|nr:hypothetical protein IZU99_09525 [Oscillospiraceae bacterium CM]
MKKYVITTSVLLFLFALIVFFFSPNLNPLYGEGLAFWAFLITVVSLAFMMMRSGRQNIVFSMSGAVRYKLPNKGRFYLLAAGAPWVLFILAGIFSAPLFHVNVYKEQLAEPQLREFAADVQPIDISQLPVVDSELASLLADKKLGERSSLGSQVTLGDPTIQNVNGKLVWAVPLLHSGFFKWLSDLDGTPGYILVSATNPRDVTYVENYSIKYQPNAYLLDNLMRHARFSGGLFTGMTDYSFEINDEGRPYWVITTYKNLVGISMPEADGILLIDAATGETTRYNLDNIPAWVDRVQPEDFLMTQLNNRGNYIHGLFNFSNKDKFQTSEGEAIVYNDGRCYLYTGLTSVGADESTIGFVLIDMVNKTPYYYQIGGATEYAAQQSAEGKVQNLQYTASFPLITNVDGKPAYFMTLKDDAALIKQYAFVSVSDYTSVGNGETIGDAITNFRSVINQSGGSSAIDTSGQQETLSGKIERISSQISGGNTIYYIILAEKPEKIFTAVADLSPELSLTQEGDAVSITYTKTDKTVIGLSTFDNLQYTQK